MHDILNQLRERLLRAGVKHSVATRYVLKLQEHVEDSMAALEAAGATQEDAMKSTWVRLGDMETLAAPMIADRRFHSWAARAPWLAFLAVPVLVYIAVVACLAYALVAMHPAWFETNTHFFPVIAAFVAPVAIAWLLAVTAWRQRSPWLWPLLRIGFTVILAAMAQLQVALPALDERGAISLSLTTPSMLHGVLLLMVALAPFGLLRLKAMHSIES